MAVHLSNSIRILQLSHRRPLRQPVLPQIVSRHMLCVMCVGTQLCVSRHVVCDVCRDTVMCVATRCV
jgi:hypothetical protein